MHGFGLKDDTVGRSNEAVVTKEASHEWSPNDVRKSYHGRTGSHFADVLPELFESESDRRKTRGRSPLFPKTEDSRQERHNSDKVWQISSKSQRARASTGAKTEDQGTVRVVRQSIGLAYKIS